MCLVRLLGTAFLSGVGSVHFRVYAFGDYTTLGEILFGRFFELNLGRWENALSKIEVGNHERDGLIMECLLLGMQVTVDPLDDS